MEERGFSFLKKKGYIYKSGENKYLNIYCGLYILFFLFTVLLI